MGIDYSQGGRGHCTGNYACPQSFGNTIYHLKLWGHIFSLDYVVQTSKVSTFLPKILKLIYLIPHITELYSDMAIDNKLFDSEYIVIPATRNIKG